MGHEHERQRPAGVVSSNRLNDSPAGLAIVVPCTRRRTGLPSHVLVPPAKSGLEEFWFAKVEDVKSVASERLVRRFGSVDRSVLNTLRDVLATLFEL